MIAPPISSNLSISAATRQPVTDDGLTKLRQSYNDDAEMASETDNDCWEVATSESSQIRLDGRLISIRRFMWAQERFPLPSWIRLTATCENSRCMRPSHMDTTNAAINPRSKQYYANWDNGPERMEAIRSNPTLAVADGKITGFLVCDGIELIEYRAFAEWCEEYASPMILAYPKLGALRVMFPWADSPSVLATVAGAVAAGGWQGSNVFEWPNDSHSRWLQAKYPRGTTVSRVKAGEATSVARVIVAGFSERFAAALPEGIAPTYSTIVPNAPALELFFLEYLRVHPVPDKGIVASRLMAGFRQFCQETPNGPDTSRLNPTNFAPILKAAGLTKRHTKSGNVWLPA